VAMRRLRQLAHVPLAIDARELEAGLAARAGFTEASAAAPIVDRLRREVPLGRASWEMQARLAGPLDAALLQISPDDPVLVRAMLYEGEDGTPLMLGETCHRSDMVRCGFDMDMRAGEGRAEMRDWTAETFPEAPAAGLAARPDRAQ
jgi:DNA-binding GntR family transcriptional regulator